jgi:antagonist of KipI
MSITVLEPGLLTSLQDLGRFGYQQFGVVVSGAMDTFALRVANTLVANQEDAAGLEITLRGPVLHFEQDLLIAICGADLTPTVDGHVAKLGRPMAVRQGSVLRFGESRHGCRAYLAIAGGIDVPPVMGSRSTYLRAQFGGLEGRALRAGDVLKTHASPPSVARRVQRWLDAANPAPLYCPSWTAVETQVVSNDPVIVVRAIRGAQFDWFDTASQQSFFSTEFEVTPQSDRMGYRLAGPRLRLRSDREMISEAVTAGTIQVPSAGQPIVLMADRQTTGGYPKIADAATVDLSALAQARPGDKIRFQEISIEAAQQLIRTRQANLEMLKQALVLRENES